MKHIFIINPVAGNGKYQIELEQNIKKYFEGKTEEYEIYYTKAVGDAVSYVRKKCEENVQYIIYACGGDGTLHEVVNAAYGFEHIAIGLIPCGSGNDFVKNFNDFEKFYDIEAQVNGAVENVDIIKVNDRYSISVCNIGFDADAAFYMSKFKKIPFLTGPTRYYLGVLVALMKTLGKKLRYQLDDSILDGCYAVSVVANGSYYGSGYKCAPYAGISDGYLDICTVDKIPRLKILDLIGSYKKGEHTVNPRTKDITNYRRSKKVVVTSDKMIQMCIDGEKLESEKITLEVIEGGLKINVPDGASIIQAKEISGKNNI